MEKMVMTRDEFELRYISFLGMSRRFRLSRDESTLLDLVKITSQ